MSHQTEGMVQLLARDLRPVRRLPRLRWILTAVVTTGLGVATVTAALHGLYLDVRATQPLLTYATCGLGILVFAAGALLAALGASVPGRERIARVGALLVAAAVAVWVPTAVAMALEGRAVGPVDGAWLEGAARCLVAAVGVGALPTLVLLYFLARAFPHRPARTAAMGAAGSLALGALAIHGICPAAGLLHIALSHVVAPLAVGAGLGVLALVLARRIAEARRASR